MAEIYLENNDALNVLYKLDTESIDLIYCDLPYGTTQCSWDEVIPYSDMWFQIRRIAKKKCSNSISRTTTFYKCFNYE